MNFKVSKKKTDGKWWSWGSIKENQYGNLQLSFKNTPEFKQMINESGDWLNFSLFEDKPKDLPSAESTTDEEIPF